MKLYQQLANDLTVLICQGALKPGDRVPSVRETSRERGMSPAAVIHAYELLEGQGFIEIVVTGGALETLNLSLQSLTRVLDKHPVRACWFMTSFQNRLGALVPDVGCGRAVRPSAARFHGDPRPSCDHSDGGGVRLRLSYIG
jgi:DNA-binding transcriptional MocR family regulator